MNPPTPPLTLATTVTWAKPALVALLAFSSWMAGAMKLLAPARIVEDSLCGAS
jgi:hypothetical protein